VTDVVPAIVLSPRGYDAVLFDLDGVLTKTAAVHAAAWKKLFDSFLAQRATEAGEPFIHSTSKGIMRCTLMASRVTTV